MNQSSIKIRSAQIGTSGALAGGMFSWLTGGDEGPKKEPNQDSPPSKLRTISNNGPDSNVTTITSPTNISVISDSPRREVEGQATSNETKAPQTTPPARQQSPAIDITTKSPIVTKTLNTTPLPPKTSSTQQRGGSMLNTTQRQSQTEDFHNEVVISDLNDLAYELPPTQQRAYDALNPPSQAEQLIRSEFEDKVSQLAQFKRDNMVARFPAQSVDDARLYFNLNREIDQLEDELPESKLFLDEDIDKNGKGIEYNWGEDDESVLTPRQRHTRDKIQAKRKKENQKSAGRLLTTRTFEFNHFQQQRAKQHFEHLKKLREERREKALQRDQGDERTLLERANDIEHIDELDIEGYPGGNKWDSSYSGMIGSDPREQRLDEIDWLNPSHMDFDHIITILEDQFDLPFTSLIKTMPLDELQALIIKEISQNQWYWIEDEQDAHRIELLGKIEKVIQNGQFDDLYDLPGQIPPRLEFPDDDDDPAAIAYLTPLQRELVNHSMHIMTASYFGDANSQLETQRYSLDMIDFFEQHRAKALNEHEKRYMKRRNHHLGRFNKLQKERNEILQGKRNFDASVIDNMESRLANKILWRQQREQFGMEIEFDPEIDQAINDVVETRFETIKNASRLLKEIQEQEDAMERESEKAEMNGGIVDNDLMTQIDEKINKLLEELNAEQNPDLATTTTTTKRTKILIPGKNLGDLKLDELVDYNRLKDEYKQREKEFDSNMNEFLEDERAFRFQLNNNQLSQDDAEEKLTRLDDEFVDLMDSFYVDEKSKIKADLQTNLFEIFDFTTRAEQHNFLSSFGILDPLPPADSLIQPSRTEIEGSVKIIDSIFGAPDDSFFFYDEIRNTLKRLNPSEHSALKLRPPPSDPAIDQYRALRRAAYYHSNGANSSSAKQNKRNSLDVLLARVEAKDPTLTPAEYQLVKNFILNPHQFDGAELDYPLLSLQDDPLRYQEMTDFGLTASEVYSDLIDEGYKLFNTPNPQDRNKVSIQSPTGETTGLYTPEQLQRMLILDNYEQLQHKTQRRKEFALRMKEHNPDLAENNFQGYHFDLIQPYDPFYLSMGFPVEERGGQPPSLDALAKFNSSEQSRHLPYFYNVEMDAMYAIPLNHFESYYNSYGSSGQRDVEVFPIYFGTDFKVEDEKLTGNFPVSKIPTVLAGLEYIDLGSMKLSLDYLKKL